MTVLLGGVGESIHARLIVPGDAAATANNYLDQASLLRLGFTSYLVEAACLIAATALL